MHTQVLTKAPSCRVTGEDPFYRFADFRVRPEQPTLAFPQPLLLSDNFFRPRWCGVGDRRLKNVGIIMEWLPGVGKPHLQRVVAALVPKLMRERSLDLTNAAAQALGLGKISCRLLHPFGLICRFPCCHFVDLTRGLMRGWPVCLSLS